MNRRENIIVLLRTLDAASAGPGGTHLEKHSGLHEARPLHESVLWHQGSYSELADALWHLHRFTTAYHAVRDTYVVPRTYVDPEKEREDLLLAGRGVDYLDKRMPIVVRVPECFRPYRKKRDRDPYIRELHVKGVSQRRLAAQFGLSKTQVHRIIHAVPSDRVNR